MNHLTNLLSSFFLAESSATVRRLILISFPFLTALVLGLDSQQLAAQDIDLQGVANAVTIAYFCLLLFALRPDQKLMALVFVPFSAVGEYVFSLIFGLYHYRLWEVPIYVPFGHAILFSTGLLVCELPWLTKKEATLRPIFIGTYTALFGAVILLLQDSLSAVFGLVFLWTLRRKGYQTLYFVMGFLVLYIELLGTGFGCWRWVDHPFNISFMHAANPPFGAFACYVLADLGVMKIVRKISPQLGVEVTRYRTA